jgi:hypothetical protein
MSWSPTEIRRVIKVLHTSTRPALVVTDAGRAFVKALGNPEGPHSLVCELLGTRLARWLGLATFDLALLPYDGDPPIAFPDGTRASPGHALAIRWQDGRDWDGSAEDLAFVENRRDVAGLVVLDTWTLNRDRYFAGRGTTRCNVKNVFLSEEGAKRGKYRLMAIDHTACFRGSTEITRRVAHIDRVQDPDVYGLFDAFRAYLRAGSVRPFADKLRQLSHGDVRSFVREIPREWDLEDDLRSALTDFIVRRADFLADQIVAMVGDRDPQLTLPIRDTSKEG